MIANIIDKLTNFTRWIAVITMVFMMFFVFVAVMSRKLIHPIVGDVELVQLGMVVLIMCGLAYTEKMNEHISVGLIVDKFPPKAQYILDIVAYLLNVIVAVVIAYVFIEVGITHKTEMQLKTNLLNIPFYPFDFLMVIGFFLWGLQALLKLVRSIQNVFVRTAHSIDTDMKG